MAPAYLGDLVQGTNMPCNTRSKLSLNLAVPTVKATNFGLHSFRYFAVKIWNSLLADFKSESDLKSFKKLSQHGTVSLVFVVCVNL